MAGYAIGKRVALGFPGGLTRNTDNQVNAYPNKGEVAIEFGAPVVREGDGVKAWDSDSVATDFIGVAVRIVKTNDTYLANDAKFNPGDAVDVLTRSGVAVLCVKDATATSNPVAGGKVYIRKATGDFVAAAEGTGGADTVAVPNAIWATSYRDADGIAEITLLERLA